MCWGCAVYKITEKRSCWQCGKAKITSENHLIKELQVREFIKCNVKNNQVEYLKDPFSPDSVCSKDNCNPSDSSNDYDANSDSSMKVDALSSTENLLSFNEGSEDDLTQFIVDHYLEEGNSEKEEMMIRSFTQGKDRNWIFETYMQCNKTGIGNWDPGC